MFKSKLKLSWFAMATMAFYAMGCDAIFADTDHHDNDTSDTSGNDTDGNQDAAVIIFGRVVDADTGADISGATVSAGSASVVTNEQGYFSLSNVQPGTQVLVNAKATGFAKSSKPVTTPASGTLYTELRMLGWDAETSFDSAKGGTVSDKTSGASVTFPAGSLDATGTVTASLTYLNATVPGELSAFPGDFMTDQEELLESFGAIGIEVTDMSGNEVNIISGQFAQATIPVSIAQKTIPLWSYNEITGDWIEEGVLSGCDDGICDAALPHLSWWNADKVYETTCLNVCVNNGSGTPSKDVLVEARGVDYNGVSTGYTGADGCACLDVRLSSQVEVVGITSGGVTTPVTLSTQSSITSCDQGGCQSLHTPLIVEAPKFQASLTWSKQPSDLDTHFTGPCGSDWTSHYCDATTNRFRIYYSSQGSLTAEPFAYLDTDDTDAFGPEIVTLTRCYEGVYRYSVHNYSGSPGMELSDAKVMLFLPDGSSRIESVPTSNPNFDIYWLVGDLTCDGACNCSWTSINTFNDGTAIHP